MPLQTKGPTSVEREIPSLSQAPIQLRHYWDDHTPPVDLGTIYPIEILRVVVVGGLSYDYIVSSGSLDKDQDQGGWSWLIGN